MVRAYDSNDATVGVCTSIDRSSRTQSADCGAASFQYVRTYVHVRTRLESDPERYTNGGTVVVVGAGFDGAVVYMNIAQ